jgi:NADPH-dependent glutamate synthase beta subunit-like oxidoreductase/Pyruvate/2-oxoacid:ferredoxin oxidoreductase delta subunit
MGLLKKVDKAKPLRSMNRGGADGISALRPAQVVKLPPCSKTCPSDNDIRGWLTIIAQREKLGLGLEEACDRAFAIEAETNPFPAIMGRVCPHPCEGQCNRSHKDGAVGINSVERFIGDWAIARDLPLPKLEVGGPFPERIAVIGAGPSGLSCAYQMARRGYQVTVFESLAKTGGMLRYGIPVYRLPRHIIDAEVKRIQALGIEIRCNVTIGKDITLDALRRDFSAIYVAIGAHQGKKVGVPGEDGPGVYTGTEFLRQVNAGTPPPVGKRVVIVGGGDTAIDAARVCLRCGQDAASISRRMGSDVTILYRRTRDEMPAIAREIDEAIEEDIKIEFLAAPARIVRDAGGNVARMVVQRMALGEPDASGRRRPVPIEGKLDEIEVDTVVAAVSQQPDVKALGAFQEKGWLAIDDWGRTQEEKVWSGGDNVNLGLATTSIGQGRKAAVSMHATLRGIEPRLNGRGPDIGPERIKMDFFESRLPVQRSVMGPDERLANPAAEIDRGITEQQALAEVSRCFSCGSCFGCERCWMYCTPSCFKKVTVTTPPKPGDYYTVKLDTCDGCKKCADECPCGFLDMA